MGEGFRRAGPQQTINNEIFNSNLNFIYYLLSNSYCKPTNTTVNIKSYFVATTLNLVSTNLHAFTNLHALHPINPIDCFNPVRKFNQKNKENFMVSMKRKVPKSETSYIS